MLSQRFVDWIVSLAMHGVVPCVPCGALRSVLDAGLSEAVEFVRVLGQGLYDQCVEILVSVEPLLAMLHALLVALWLFVPSGQRH